MCLIACHTSNIMDANSSPKTDNGIDTLPRGSCETMRANIVRRPGTTNKLHLSIRVHVS
jgi:hypothetical protein